MMLAAALVAALAAPSHAVVMSVLPAPKPIALSSFMMHAESHVARLATMAPIDAAHELAARRLSADPAAHAAREAVRLMLSVAELRQDEKTRNLAELTMGPHVLARIDAEASRLRGASEFPEVAHALSWARARAYTRATALGHELHVEHESIGKAMSSDPARLWTHRELHIDEDAGQAVVLRTASDETLVAMARRMEDGFPQARAEYAEKRHLSEEAIETPSDLWPSYSAIMAEIQRRPGAVAGYQLSLPQPEGPLN